MHTHMCWRIYKHKFWSLGTVQLGSRPCASKNSSRNRLNGATCSKENGGASALFINDLKTTWSKRSCMICLKKFRRNTWKQSSKLWLELQSAWEAKPPPSWREKGVAVADFTGKKDSTWAKLMSTPFKVNNGLTICPNCLANSAGYSAVSLLK